MRRRDILSCSRIIRLKRSCLLFRRKLTRATRSLFRREIIMGLTLVEKIAARHADGLAPGTVVHAGDFMSIRPRHVMTHDNTGAVIPKFRQIGATKIADPAQPVFAIDHDIQNVSPKNLEKYAKIDAFAREHGIDFYPEGTGISHQVLVVPCDVV